MKRFFKVFKDGIVKENPLLMMMVGLCSSLAVTTSVENGLGMGLATTFVLLMSEIIISICKNVIPKTVRIPIFIITFAAFGTMIDYILQAYFPALSANLGIFIPLISINCILMARIEAFASKESVGIAAADGLGVGLGITLVWGGISVIRELFGNGSILDVAVFGDTIEPILFFVLPSGGFLVFAFFASLGLTLKRIVRYRGSPNFGLENKKSFTAPELRH
jgi:electron transport complex protein RnfE